MNSEAEKAHAVRCTPYETKPGEILGDAMKKKDRAAMSSDWTLRPSPRFELLYREQYEEAGGKGEYDRGVLTTKLCQWSEFYDEVRRFRSCKDYVWRGQEQHGDGWTLKSKFDRQNPGENRNTLLKLHRAQFSEAIRGRHGQDPPKLEEDELWALGQHNGLATPLLDWTTSPFVAAYFAFWRRKENTSDRVVYGLNRGIRRWYRADTNETLISFPKIEAHENARFLAQGGVVTKAVAGEDIKERIKKCYHETNHRNRIVLVEIIVPNSERDECLRDLNWMNINHASLFPDIYGAAAFCNWILENEVQARKLPSATYPPRTQATW